jgi:hypothetical protein
MKLSSNLLNETPLAHIKENKMKRRNEEMKKIINRYFDFIGEKNEGFSYEI